MTAFLRPIGGRSASIFIVSRSVDRLRCSLHANDEGLHCALWGDLVDSAGLSVLAPGGDQ
jgi:hypothetical protein